MKLQASPQDMNQKTVFTISRQASEHLTSIIE